MAYRYNLFMVEDESLMDFRYLERIDELKNEIKKFYKEYGPLEQYLSNFLSFYEYREGKKRKKREKEIMNKRTIKEEKATTSINAFTISFIIKE